MLDRTMVSGNGNYVAKRDININQYINGTIEFSELQSIESDYVHLLNENNVVKHVCEQCVTVLHAITGMGKTAMARAVGIALKEEYTPFFLDSTNLSLLSIEKKILDKSVEENDLLILDNVVHDVENLVEWIVHQYGVQIPLTTRIIITTQNSKRVNERFLVQLSQPEFEEAKKILLRNIDNSKRDQVNERQIQKFIEDVSALPLILKLVNKTIRYDGVPFEEFFDDTNLAILLEDESSEDRVVDRLLRNVIFKHRSSIGILKWLGTAYGDRYLLNELVGTAEMLAMKHIGIFSRNGYPNKKSIKMHDVVYKAIMHSDADAPESLEQKFWRYLLGIDESEKFINAIFCYKNKIQELNDGSLTWNFKSYALIRVLTDTELMSEKLDSRFSVPDVDEIALMDKLNREYAYRSIIDFRERWQHILDPESKKAFISETCRICTDMIAFEESEDLRLRLGHHLGKAYFWLNDMEEAIRNFEAVLQFKTDNYESILQLARCYKRLRNFDEAAALLNKILMDGYDSSQRVHMSVLLAALKELQHDNFQDLREKFVIQKWESFKEIILSTSNFDYDQPFETFVVIGRKIAYEYPEYYEELAEQLPIRISPEGKDDKFLFDIAEFCLTRYLHSKDTDDKDDMLLKKAELYFSKIKSPSNYQLTRWSILYLEQGKFDKALSILEKIDKIDRFSMYRKAQAYLGLGMLEEARFSINFCIEETERAPDKYLSTFYMLKGDIWEQDRKVPIDWYKKALQCCDNEKYRHTIEQKIRRCVQS